MDPTLLEVLRKIMAWTPPEGYRRIVSIAPDGAGPRDGDPPFSVMVGVYDGPLVVDDELEWSTPGGLALVLGELDGRLDALDARARAERAAATAAGRFSPAFSGN